MSTCSPLHCSHFANFLGNVQSSLLAAPCVGDGQLVRRNGATDLSTYCKPVKVLSSALRNFQPYLQGLAAAHCQPASCCSASRITRRLNQTSKLYSKYFHQMDELCTALYIIHKWHIMRVTTKVSKYISLGSFPLPTKDT